MFPDVLACFSVSSAALRQQIEDWCQLLFDLITLRSKQQGILFKVISLLADELLLKYK